MIVDRNIALQKRPFLVRAAVVYMITNVINGKKYIGVTCQKLYRRKCSHFCDAKNGKDGILGRAIRLYGKKNFKCDVMVECASFEVALLEEIRLIEELKPEYNATKGGDGSTGWRHTADAKKRMSIAKTGKPLLAARGKIVSSELREKARQYGLSNKHVWEKYRCMGPKSRRRMVICHYDGKIFESAASAAGYYGVSKSQIIEVCLRNKSRHTVRGLTFSYFKEKVA